MREPSTPIEPKGATPAATPSQLFPHPVLSALLALAWLLLSHSVALVHLLSAALIGWGLPRWLAPFLLPAGPLRWGGAVRLLLRVLWDIVRSNLVVARLTLGSMDKPRPAWLRVPLACEHDRVNALFASIITTTPGTVSATVDEGRREILVHALNCDDPQAMVRDMKQRYERPLLAIFGVEATGQSQPNGSQT